MVSAVFKTVYLFLALFALPKVLAAPGTAGVDLHKRITDGEMLAMHNKIRAQLGSPPLTWGANFAGVARLQVATCLKTEVRRVIELVSIQDSFEFALKYWIAGGPSLEQVRSKNAKYFGCAVGDCDGTTLTVCMYDAK